MNNRNNRIAIVSMARIANILKPRIAIVSMAHFAIILMAAVLLAACATDPTGNPNTPAAAAADTPVVMQDLDIVSGQTIYVPAYSEVPFTGGGRVIDMTVTLAVHNTDPDSAIILNSVRYYGADGQLVREHLDAPRQLGPLASAEFVVEAERGRGVGTNFIVEWVAEEAVYEPVVEALMLNATGNQGVSFISVGRVVSQID
ncbi:conserved exported protein of unknown function [Candidatus Promineifilum breve]|uniref:DUF3124 domain-containing protein n=1 Tax=Candidatus Promineifilum breve TaxID=1806508 RepID=A0A160T8T0_9CHLR|nr:DUF3124 domain-containing protein [Candidatus Promineifilum breve]CUS06159.1 conserved exported protein of unknown function [Candidatus Promineifilum breve]